ncbi:hypothetical protein [Billgrantia endophytica]|uniref:Uncharacterized protein n=1 Tax=Billgrantia endophytica TaxID=2033802 RepID=A0A2N7TZA3_9GAMM|nr:hypothetical protein [Halomonas endophytica]PMR73483.1 hypothetical protein C1H69_17315 [Halomonas endophytica]
MNTERSQLYYTTVFLHVSFQAIKHSMAGKEENSMPCWLDTNLIMMLSRELQECSMSARPFGDVKQALDTAIYHCGLLLAQCPGALNSQLCRHHLDAIMTPLKDAIAVLAPPAPNSQPSGTLQTYARKLFKGWRNS